MKRNTPGTTRSSLPTLQRLLKATRPGIFQNAFLEIQPVAIIFLLVLFFFFLKHTYKNLQQRHINNFSTDSCNSSYNHRFQVLLRIIWHNHWDLTKQIKQPRSWINAYQLIKLSKHLKLFRVVLLLFNSYKILFYFYFIEIWYWSLLFLKK